MTPDGEARVDNELDYDETASGLACAGQRGAGGEASTRVLKHPTTELRRVCVPTHVVLVQAWGHGTPEVSVLCVCGTWYEAEKKRLRAGAVRTPGRGSVLRQSHHDVVEV